MIYTSLKTEINALKKFIQLSLVLLLTLLTFGVNVTAQYESTMDSKYITASTGYGGFLVGSYSRALPGLLVDYEKRGLIGSKHLKGNTDFTRFLISGFYFNHQRARYSYRYLYNYDVTIMGFGVRVGVDLLKVINETANEGIDIPNLEVYTGIQWGYSFWQSKYDWTGFNQFSPRYFFSIRYFISDKWGARLEYGRTAYRRANIGVTYRFE